MTFIDTALAYGDGHSERLIAKARTSAVVATKIPPKNGLWPAASDSKLADVFPAHHVRTATETSLRNLGVATIELQQLHVWHDAWLDQSEWGTTRNEMERLVAVGKVRHWGISINDHAPETALRAVRDPIFATAQVIYNIFDRSPENELFALAREERIGIIARVPFDEGTLTGATGTFGAGVGPRRRGARMRSVSFWVTAPRPFPSLPCVSCWPGRRFRRSFPACVGRSTPGRTRRYPTAGGSIPSYSTGSKPTPGKKIGTVVDDWVGFWPERSYPLSRLRRVH